LKVPFGKYTNLPITKENTSEEIREFVEQSYETLNKAVYGHREAKSEIIQTICKWISNPTSKGTVIGLKGPMGNGKTTLVKKGISQAIKKPFAFITLGGATDASFLEGHSYTYEGALPGRIIQILTSSNINCMDPIIYFDELDKVSDTAKGQEIQNLLCHLTDFSQNDEYHDKYYHGIDFDLSRAIFIFSFNDESLINPILKDRMKVIDTKGFSTREKIELTNDFLIPEIVKDIGFDQSNFSIENSVIQHIINHYTNEKGVRKLKGCLQTILTKLNVISLLDTKDKKYYKIINVDKIIKKFPVDITIDLVNNLLTKSKIDDIFSKSGMYS